MTFTIKNRGLGFPTLALWLSLLLFGWGAAQGQTAPSPLTGKIIHVYNPFGVKLPLVNLSGVGYDMTPESGNWYKLDFSAFGGSLQDWMKDFGIRTGDWTWLIPTGVGTKEGVFGVDIFAGANEVWIVVDPSGPATAAPLILISAPRTVHVFNPWPVSGPEIVIGGVNRTMLSDKGHCGWNVAYILQSGPVSGYFASAADGEAWGQGGIGDKTP